MRLLKPIRPERQKPLDECPDAPSNTSPELPAPTASRRRSRPRIAVNDDRLARERSLILAAQAGDQAAAEQLLDDYAPLVERAARAWRRPGLELDDLRQAARIGVLTAAQKWRPGRGKGRGREAGLARLARLESDNACRECVRQAGGPVVLPRSGAVETALRYKDAIAAEIDEAVAAGATVAEAEREACGRRGIKPELYADALYAAGAQSVEIQDRPDVLSRGGVDLSAARPTAVLDLVPSETLDPEQAYAEAEDQALQPERLRRLRAALELLPDDERKAIAARLRGSAPPPTLREAEQRAMERLRELLEEAEAQELERRRAARDAEDS